VAGVVTVSKPLAAAACWDFEAQEVNAMAVKATAAIVSVDFFIYFLLWLVMKFKYNDHGEEACGATIVRIEG
jgi:hypothetical protein